MSNSIKTSENLIIAAVLPLVLFIKSTIRKIITFIISIIGIYPLLLIICAGLALGGNTQKAEGEEIWIYNKGPPQTTVPSILKINHIEGSQEGWDTRDKVYKDNPNSALEIYSLNEEYFNDTGITDKLIKDSRHINSTTNYIIELLNEGFSGEIINNYLTFQVIDSNNLDWKNVFFEINGEKTDIKYITSNGTTTGNIPLGTLQGSQSGIYNSGTLQFFNHADLNRDRKVDASDLEKFSNEYLKNNTSDPNRFGSYVGNDVNDLGAYADINRSGSVDFHDFAYLGNEWLWDANDPNTW